MSTLRRLYIDFYVLVYALYAFFNKGIAYTYLAEILLVVGVLLILKEIRQFEITWSNPVKIMLLFLMITMAFMVRGISSYPLMEVVRDSFMFNYAIFVLIIFMFKDNLEYFKQRLFSIYKWFPLVAVGGFLLLSLVPFFEEFKPFGEIPLLLYKFGDMGVHLLISSLLMLNGYIQMPKKQAILNTILTIYLFLVIAAYSRSGMMSYGLGMFLFFVFTKKASLKQFMLEWLRYLPILILLAMSFYLATKLKENFQGRKVGLEQLQENVTSIFSEKDGTLNENKVWRLIWWGKIIDDSFTIPNLLIGRGLGMSMAEVDDIKTDEDGLRSPHSFHVNILGRFGWPVFVLWLYWIWLIIKPLRKKEISQYYFTLLCIFTVFILNASFDVYLEGPMGAFPFWTFVGLIFVDENRIG